jgi:hypothetical protein
MIKEKNWAVFHWPERCDAFAKIINQLEGSEVHDYGCGNAALKSSIVGKKYICYDINNLPNVDIVIDINKGIPKLDPTTIKDRVACCQGVLESLEDVPKFFRELYENFKQVVFSYVNMERSYLATTFGVKNCPLLSFVELTQIVTKNFGGNKPTVEKILCSEDMKYVEQIIFIVVKA